MSGIKIMEVDSSACVRVKVGESEWFRIYSRVRQGCIIFPLAVQCIYGWKDKGGEDGDGNEGSELHGGWERVDIAWPLLYR